MTTPSAALVLARAATRLAARCAALEERLDVDDAEPSWALYLATLQTLCAVLATTSPEATGRLLTTGELAQRLGVSSKTVLRRKARGDLKPAATLGKRGRAALRWNGDGRPT